MTTKEIIAGVVVVGLVIFGISALTNNDADKDVVTDLQNNGQPSATANPGEESKFSFNCPNDKPLTIEYKGDGSREAELEYDGDNYDLAIQPTGSGTMYASEDGNVVFREGGGSAYLEVDGQRVVENCAL